MTDETTVVAGEEVVEETAPVAETVEETPAVEVEAAPEAEVAA